MDINIISKIFDNVLSDIESKCRDGTKGTGGVVIYGKGEAPKYELDDGGLTVDLLNRIADDMASRWGLEVSIDANGKREVSKTKFALWDDRNKTYIRLNKILKHQDWIDFTNNGKGAYDLDEVLRYYNDLNPLAKERMGGLVFETNNGSSNNRLYDGAYDIVNPIAISSMVYHEHDEKGYQLSGIMKRDSRMPSQYNMKQVMGHEAGHASERIVSKKDADVLRKASVTGSKNKFNRNQLTTDSEREVYDNLIRYNRKGNANDLSGSKEYDDAQSKQKVRMASEYSASYSSYGDRHSEDCAEVMSAVAFRGASSQEKSEFRMTYNNGKTVGLDEFISDHQATYDLCCNYVDGKVKHSDLHSPFSGEQYS